MTRGKKKKRASVQKALWNNETWDRVPTAYRYLIDGERYVLVDGKHVPLRQMTPDLFKKIGARKYQKQS